MAAETRPVFILEISVLSERRLLANWRTGMGEEEGSASAGEFLTGNGMQVVAKSRLAHCHTWRRNSFAFLDFT